MIAPTDADTLLICPVGAPLRVTRIADQDPAFLRFIEDNDLKPGQAIDVETRDTAADAVRLDWRNRRSITIGCYRRPYGVEAARRGVRLRRWAAAMALAMLAPARSAAAQTPPKPPREASRKFEILDNSFLVEESFNQDAGVVQNILSWTQSRDGIWTATFTQEWPLGSITHQFSYTLPFSHNAIATGVDDVLLNYRYQLFQESSTRPAVAPRVSIVLPTGRVADDHGSGAVGLQVNVAASKQLGNLYVHANGGWTWLPGVKLNRGAGHPTTSLTSPHIAASAVWRVTPMFNLMMEAVFDLAEGIDEGAVFRTHVTTWSPGFRRGWNFGERQVVVGAALPITRSAGVSEVSALLYFSYELHLR